MIRNSFRHAGRQHRDAIAEALKRPVYTAPSEAAAEEGFLEFTGVLGAEVSGDRQVVENALAEFVPFFDYDVEIGKVICSTNSIESISARCRPAVRAQGHFRTRTAALNASTW